MVELAGAESETELLLDTGSQLTIIRRTVIERLGLDLDQDVADRPRELGLGVGGELRLVRLRVQLAFPESDSPSRAYTVFARASLERDRGAGLPSLLGMDVLSSFKLTVSERESLVQLEPSST